MPGKRRGYRRGMHARAEAGRNARCWLWCCLSEDAVGFRVDPSRRAGAAAQLVGSLGRAGTAVLACDRCSAYVKLARGHVEQFVLSICRARYRRDDVALGSVAGDAGEGGRNAGTDRDAESAERGATGALGPAKGPGGAVGAVPGGAAADGAQQSLLKQREGLSVFLTPAFVPMDNNPVERALRRPVVGREFSCGLHSEDGAALQGVLLSVLPTLNMAGISLRRWLEAFLGARAVVRDPRAWLQRGISEDRVRALRAPQREAGPVP